MNFNLSMFKSFSFIICIVSNLYCSSLCLASEQKKKMLIYHAGLEYFDSTYMISLLVELEKKITGYKIHVIDSSELTIAQLKSQIESSKNCVLTIGKQALETVLTARDSTPIFSTLVSQTSLDSLAKSYYRLDSRVTGIYEEQPFVRQLLLSKAVDKNNKNVSVILGRKTRYFLDDFRIVSNQLSLNLSFDILKHQESAQQSLTRLSESKGFLIILNEKQQYSEQNLQSLLVTSHNQKIPMIGGKVSDSINAALASVYTPYKSLAKEVASGLHQMCKNNILPNLKHSTHFAVVINPQIAEFLNYAYLDEKELANSISISEKQNQKTNGRLER